MGVRQKPKSLVTLWSRARRVLDSGFSGVRTGILYVVIITNFMVPLPCILIARMPEAEANMILAAT